MTPFYATQEGTRLLEMAQAFYTNAESPNEEEMELVFIYLLNRDSEKLAELLKNFEVQE